MKVTKNYSAKTGGKVPIAKPVEDGLEWPHHAKEPQTSGFSRRDSREPRNSSPAATDSVVRACDSLAESLEASLKLGDTQLQGVALCLEGVALQNAALNLQILRIEARKNRNKPLL